MEVGRKGHGDLEHQNTQFTRHCIFKFHYNLGRGSWYRYGESPSSICSEDLDASHAFVFMLYGRTSNHHINETIAESMSLRWDTLPCAFVVFFEFSCKHDFLPPQTRMNSCKLPSFQTCPLLVELGAGAEFAPIQWPAEESTHRNPHMNCASPIV